MPSALDDRSRFLTIEVISENCREDLILRHAFAKQEPDRDFPQAQTAHDNFWDFISLTPESMNMVLWIMSDRTIPRSFRFMQGFGVHTFRLVNADGKSTFVKFHWKPKLGLQSVVWNEALKINGADPDFHRRDLWDAIQNGDYPTAHIRMHARAPHLGEIMKRHPRSRNYRWLPTGLAGAGLAAAAVLGTTALLVARRARRAERENPPHRPLPRY
jgi:hypothetical protein